MKPSPEYIQPRPVKTVFGLIDHMLLGVTDAHNHVWIEAVAGAESAAPVLDEEEKIIEELRSYRADGGTSLLDCQLRGSGRNGNMLARLATQSGVNLIACKGFHRRKYYPPEYRLFTASETKIAEHFISEYTTALEECQDEEVAVRAGFIKIALEVDWKEIPQAALEATAAAAFETGALIAIHTEKGLLAEKAILYFDNQHIKPHQLVLCHMDKRPDFGLHSEIARFGTLLEYDTFFRPKYEPETRLWPLLFDMLAYGFDDSIALATDMAEKEMYTSIGKGPGLASLPREISARLSRANQSDDVIRQLIGGNISRRLAGLT